jgi:hypothetical protein
MRFFSLVPIDSLWFVLKCMIMTERKPSFTRSGLIPSAFCLMKLFGIFLSTFLRTYMRNF